MALSNLDIKKLPNLAKNNLGTVNLVHDNLANNNPMNYRMKVSVNKMRYGVLPKPAYQPSQFQQDMDRRLDYTFDYNNPGQVNSFADVIMNTLVRVGDNMRGVKTIKDTMKESGTDFFNLMYKGSVQPFMNKDWSVLLANNFVNFRETVDLVDNIYKGFAIEGNLNIFQPTLFDWNDAKEGMRKAIVERENYDFDTGNGFKDFVLEMATPTNLALLGLGITTGKVGAKALEASGETAIKKRTAKAFAKKYRGSTEATIKALKTNFSNAELDALRSMSKHITNLKLLSAVNMFKKSVDVVDTFGPKMAWKTTAGVPWVAIKMISGASTYATKYLATAVGDIQKASLNTGMVSTLMDRPKYELLFNNFAEAAKVAKEKEIVVAFDHILSGAANVDNNALKATLRNFNKTFDNPKLIQQYMDDMFKSTGFVQAFDVARKAQQAKTLQKLTNDLDRFVQATTGGMYKTFDEYSNLVNMVHKLSDGSKGIDALHGTIKNLEATLYTGFAREAHEELTQVIQKVAAQVDTIKAKQNEMVDARVEKLTELNKAISKAEHFIEDVDAKAISRNIERYNEILTGLEKKLKTLEAVDTTESLTAQVRKLENLRAKGYARYQTLKQTTPDLKPFDSKTIDSSIDKVQKQLNLAKQNSKTLNAIIEEKKLYENLIGKGEQQLANFEFYTRSLQDAEEALQDFLKTGVYSTKYFEDITINPKEAIKILENYRDALIDRLNTGTLTENKMEIFSKIKKYTDNSIELLRKGALDANNSNTINNIEQYGREYLLALDNIISNLDKLPYELLKNLDLGDGLNKLTKSIYGGDIKKFTKDVAQRLEKMYGKTVTPDIIDHIKTTFYKGDVLDTKAYSEFLTETSEITKMFDEDLLDSLGKTQGVAATLESVSEEAAESVSRLKNAVSLLEAIPNDPHPGVIQTVLEELNNLKFQVKRVYDKVVRESKDLRAVDAVGKTTVNTDTFVNVLNKIEDIEGILGPTANMEIKWTKEMLQTYSLKLNATLRNMYLLDNEDLTDLIESVIADDYHTHPILASLKGMSNYNTRGLGKIRTQLGSGDAKDLLEAMKGLTSKTFDPTKESVSQLIESIDKVLEVQASAQIILDTIHGMASVKLFYDSVQEAVEEGLDKNVASIFLDAIQTTYDKPATLVSLADIADKPWMLKYEYDRIFDNMEMQLRGQSLKHTTKVLAWKDHIMKSEFVPKAEKDFFTKTFGSTGSMEHTAVADAYSEYLVHKYILKDHLEAGVKYMYVDTEASGLHKIMSSLYQVSAVDPETGVYKWFINTGVERVHLPQEDAVYHILFGDPEHLVPIEILKEKFEEIYIKGNIDVLKEHFGITADSPIEIVAAGSEAELLNISNKFIQSQKPPGGRLIYRMHNGFGYDVPLMNNRAMELGLDDFKINIHNVQDTKLILEDHLGLQRMTLDERGTIERLIHDHITRRSVELSTLGLERGAPGVEKNLNENLSKFLPTMDANFRIAFDNLTKAFDPVISKDMVAKGINLNKGSIQAYEDMVDVFIHQDGFFAELQESMRGIYDDLAGLNKIDKRLKRFKINVNSLDLSTSGRILPDNYTDFIPEKLLANHIGMDLMHFNTLDGIYVPALGVKRHVMHNLVAEYFDSGGMSVSERAMEKMTQLSGNIQNNMARIRNPHLIESFAINDLHYIQKVLMDELYSVGGDTYFSSVLRNLKPGDTPLRSFATTYEIFKIYKDIAAGTTIPVETFAGSGVYRFPLINSLVKTEGLEHIMPHLINTDEAFKNVLSEYGSQKQFFELGIKNNDLKKINELWSKLSKDRITVLDALKEFDSLKLTRLKRVAPIYRGMALQFDTIHEVVNDTLNHVTELARLGKIKDVPKNLEATLYSTLRILNEGVDAVISYNKLGQVLSMEPTDLASYLRHQGKGLIVFDNSSLFSDTYFKNRGGSQLSDIIKRNYAIEYKGLLANKEALEEFGIKIKTNYDFTFIYATDFEKIKNLKYNPAKQDFMLEDWVDLIITQGLADAGEVGEFLTGGAENKIRKAMSELLGSRSKLISLTKNSNTSTLEIMDENTMRKVIAQIKDELPDIIDTGILERAGAFEGNYFNHSVLGHIDGRRKLMEFASFNPAKTMFNATAMAEKHLGTQVQALRLVQVPDFKVTKLLESGMNPEDVVTYMKQSNHLVMGFLNGKTMPGDPSDFKLSSITIKTVKDLEFAKRMDAFIIDRQSYNKAYSIINDYKIRNSVAEFFDKVFVGTFKTGWLMWNYGVVARNIIDTAGKNVATTKDMAIIPTMFNMTKDYFKYKSTLTEIYQYAAKQDISVSVAVEEFFHKFPDIGIKKEVFDLIGEYKMVGGEMGLTKEVSKYYGDSITKMYKQVGQEKSGLSADDFREMMKLPDDVADRWLREKLPNSPDMVETLMHTKGDLLTYKRAYEMHKIHHKSDITVEDCIIYLKSGRANIGMDDTFAELAEKTSKMRIEDDIMTKMYKHPLIANSLDWNMASEEILRLSLYKYLRDTGSTTTEAMGEIIKTHFDYGHRHLYQMYMEMAMPFSNFRALSLLYWAEEMGNNAQSIEVLADAWAGLSNLQDRQPEDAMIRRSLQYQMYTGNMVLNEETGLTAKINPTPIDMMNFFMNPVEYIKGNFHSGATAAVELFTMEPYDNETEESFQSRKRTMAINTVPLVGGSINKIRKSYRDTRDPDTEEFQVNQFFINLALSPLFNTTWTPEQGGEWQRFEPYEKRQYMARGFNNYYGNRQVKSYGMYPKFNQYPKKIYPIRQPHKKMFPKINRSYPYQGYKNWSNYSTFNRHYYGATFKFKRGSVYPTKSSRSLNTAFSDMWRRSMTKKGNPKYKFLGFPTNKWTLELKVNILRNITSYTRWQ